MCYQLKSAGKAPGRVPFEPFSHPHFLCWHGSWLSRDPQTFYGPENGRCTFRTVQLHPWWLCKCSIRPAPPIFRCYALLWGGAISFYFKSVLAPPSNTSTSLWFLTDVSSNVNSIINVTELGFRLDIAEIISASGSPSSSLTPDPRRLVNIGDDSVCQESLANIH